MPDEAEKEPQDDPTVELFGEEDFALVERRDTARLVQFGATNFRSFRSFNLDVGRLTVLAGPNGAGKSSVVDVPRFISDALSLSLFAALERRGGVKAVRHKSPTKPRDFSVYADLEFSDGYSAKYQIKLKSTAGGDFVVAEEDCQTFSRNGPLARMRIKKGKVAELPAGQQRVFFRVNDSVIDDKTLGLPLYGGLPQFSPVLGFLRDMRAYSISPDKLRELQDPDEGDRLEADGRNAASVLRRLDAASRRELIEMLAFVVPGVTGVKSVTRNKLTMPVQPNGKRSATSFE